MQFTCEQDRLNRVLSMVIHAVAKGTGAFPMATNIRLKVDGDRIRLDATNLSIGITAWVEASELEEGSVAVPAQYFTNLVSALPVGKVIVSVDEAYDVKVESSRGPAHIRGLDPEEFPPMPNLDELSTKPTLLKASLLKEVIREVTIVVDDNNGREVFSNVLLQMENQKITFAAADGHGKLAFRPVPLPAESQLSGDILVPARSLTELASVLPNDGMVEIRLTPEGSQLIFSTQWLVFSSILSSGKFPNYKAALPRERQTSVTVKTADLREIVRIASLFAKTDYDAGRLTIRGSRGLEAGTLELASEAADIGGASPKIPAAVDGEDQEELIFNLATIAKLLGVISSPELVFEVGVTKAPVGVMRQVGAHTCTHSFSSMGAAR